MNPAVTDKVNNVPGSRMTARIAVMMALTQSREEEQDKAVFQRASGFRVAAVDFGIGLMHLNEVAIGSGHRVI